MTTFHPAVGGTSANVAVAVARLGHRACLWTKVGGDPLGGYVRAALDRLGVDTAWISTHPTLPTPVVFAELNPPSEPTIWFYRKPAAPDEHLTLDDIDTECIDSVPIIWIPGSVMAFEPVATTVTDLLSARCRRAHTVLDLDYRSMFWTSPDDARRAVGALLDRVTLVIGNREECRVVVGTDDPYEAARRILDRGVDMAIVKMGGDGVFAARSDGTCVQVAPIPVEVVCGLGAGDAFGGSIVHSLLTQAGMEQMLREANAAGAIVAARLLCSEDMPTLAEIETMLATGTPPARDHERVM